MHRFINIFVCTLAGSLVAHSDNPMPLKIAAIAVACLIIVSNLQEL